MTKKEIKNLANELVQLELVHNDPSTPKEDKSQAEKRIMAITNKLMNEPDNMESMLKVDALVQKMLKEK